ncbi:hypothetical protein BJV82DRAFT_620477 [Fennellomyces sp. T-0311]|nr:hypothetical protein BJV82DRAFT_620477 [Fennellomyces sp. T-0311]
MKFTTTGFVSTAAVALVALSQSASAQTAGTCPDQTVFDQCKRNEDNYIATCAQGDYACLCKWQTEKVSCWNNCPNDTGRGTEEALRITYCSQPGANVTSAIPSAPPATTASSIPTSANVSPSPSSTPKKEGAASSIGENFVFMASSFAILAAGYMFQ